MIIAHGLPVKFEQVDKGRLTEIGYDLDGNVDQGGGTHSYIYTKKSNAQNDPLSNKRPRLYAIDPSTVLNPPKPTDLLGCLIFDWLIARLKGLAGLKVLDDWRIECKSDAVFGLADLCQGNEYQKVLANETAFNKAKLGAQIKDSMISPKGVGALLRRFSFNYSSKRVDVGAKSGERVEIVRGFIEKESDFFRGAMARRLRAGTHFNETAQKWQDKKEQEIAEYGAPLIPDRPVSPTATRITIRYWMIYGMRVRSDGKNGLKDDPDFAFRYEGLFSKSQSQWICEHIEVVNAAGLGAKITNGVLSPQVSAAWAKATGIKLKRYQTYAHKLLNYKDAENANPDNTGDCTKGLDTNTPLCKPNESAVVENNSSENSDLKPKPKRVWAYKVDPKCLQKVREIMDNDKCEYMAEYYETIQNAAESTPIEPQDRPLKQRLMDFADEHRDEIFSLTHIAKTLGVEVDEVREAIRDMYDFKAIDHSQVRVLPKLIWSKLPDEPDEPDYPWLRDDDGIGGSRY
jgi:hypothetical protein